jgi:hypothetical protein
MLWVPIGEEMKTFYITTGLLALASLPQMGYAVAFLTDPWGTRIELTERTPPSGPASAQQ